MYLFTVFVLCMVFQVNALLKVPLPFRISWEQVALKYRSECLCKTGLDVGIGTNYFERGDLSSTACIRCYILCISNSLNLMDPATGEVNVLENVRQVAGTTTSMISKCKNDTERFLDYCEKSYKMYECISVNLFVPTL